MGTIRRRMGVNEGNWGCPLAKRRGVLLVASGKHGALCTPSPPLFSHFTSAEKGECFLSPAFTWNLKNIAIFQH